MKISKNSQLYRFVDSWNENFFDWHEYTVCEFIWKFIGAFLLCSFVFSFAACIIVAGLFWVYGIIESVYLLLFDYSDFKNIFGDNPTIQQVIIGVSFILTCLVILVGIVVSIFVLVRMFLYNKNKVCSIRDIMRKRCKTFVEFTD